MKEKVSDKEIRLELLFEVREALCRHYTNTMVEENIPGLMCSLRLMDDFIKMEKE